MNRKLSFAHMYHHQLGYHELPLQTVALDAVLHLPEALQVANAGPILLKPFGQWSWHVLPIFECEVTHFAGTVFTCGNTCSLGQSSFASEE